MCVCAGAGMCARVRERERVCVYVCVRALGLYGLLKRDGIDKEGVERLVSQS